MYLCNLHEYIHIRRSLTKKLELMKVHRLYDVAFPLLEQYSHGFCTLRTSSSYDLIVKSISTQLLYFILQLSALVFSRHGVCSFICIFIISISLLVCSLLQLQQFFVLWWSDDKQTDIIISCADGILFHRFLFHDPLQPRVNNRA